MPCPEHRSSEALASASARVRWSHVSFATTGIQPMRFLTSAAAWAIVWPGLGSTRHSWRASRPSSWHSHTHSQLLGKAGCVWMPQDATGIARPHCLTHAGKSGSEQSAPV